MRVRRNLRNLNWIIIDIDSQSLDKAEQNIGKAIKLLNNQRFGQARALLKETLHITPCSGEAYRLLAQIAFQFDKDYNAATDYCIDALRWNPKDHWSLVLMGNILANGKGDTESAMRYYRKALEYDPGNEVATTNIAGTELRNGNPAEAERLFRIVIDKGTDFANVYYGLTMVLVRQGKFEEAFETGVDGLKKVKDRPENPGVRTELLKMTISAAQQIAEKVNAYHVIAALKEELEPQLTMPLEIKQDDSMSLNGRLEYGPYHRRKKHILYYKGNVPSTLHTIMHELTHLEMCTAASKLGQNRIVLSGKVEYAEFCNRFRPLISKIRNGLGDNAEEQVRNLFNMFGQCLMNTPLDLFVEKHIYEKYSTLRALQFINLCKQSKDYVDSVMAPRIQSLYPASLLHIVKVCNMTTAMLVKELYGVDTVPHYKPTKAELDQATDLYEEFKAYANCKPGEEYEFVEYMLQSLHVDNLLHMNLEQNYLKAVDASDISEDAGGEMSEETGKHTDETNEANKEFAEQHPDSADNNETMMMSMYMLSALQYFNGMPKEQVKKIALEIAMLGVGGINPQKSGYRILSID